MRYLLIILLALIIGDVWSQSIIRRNSNPETYTELIYWNNDSIIDFNFDKDTVYIPSFSLITNGVRYEYVGGKAPMTNLTYENQLSYSKTLGTCGVTLLTTTWQDRTDRIMIATFREQLLNKTNISYVACDFPHAISGIKQGMYNRDSYRLILPDTMYFVDGETLPIFRESVLAKPFQTDNMRMMAEYNTTPYSINFINPSLNINPLSFNDSVKIEVNPIYQNYTERYYKYIHKASVDTSTVTPQTKNVMFIGNSITYGHLTTYDGFPTMLTSRLNDYGITANMLGTRLDRNGDTCECVSGYKMGNVVGSDNLTVTLSDPKRVFLRVANATDKTNNPTWCFPRTGAAFEDDYATNPLESEYYIFDFAKYLNSNSVANPDMIIIELGINDLTYNGFTPAQSLIQVRRGLEIICKQIDSWAVADSVYPKIGVIPIVSMGIINQSTNDTWTNEATIWLENAMTDIKGYGLTNAEVSIIPTWVSSSRDYDFDVTAERDFNSINNSKVARKLDGIHPSQNGRVRIIEVIKNWTLNKL